MKPDPLLVPPIVATLVLAAGSAMAQCPLAYDARTSAPDADAAVLASCRWDPDGTGPLPPVVVLGGEFTHLGNTHARGLAAWDPTNGSTSAIGAGQGIDGARIAALLATSGNELVVGGSFTSIDGTAAANVARWNGIGWQPLGGGVPLDVKAIVELQGGDLAAAGIPANNQPSVYRWDGTSWSPLGGGLGGPVSTLLVLPNDDLLAGGTLLPGSGHLSRWDGTSWSTFGGGTNGPVHALHRTSAGDLIAAGGFFQAGGTAANCIARWDGAAWQPLGPGFLFAVFALTELANGDLLAGGSFVETGGLPTKRVARWDGTSWSALGGGLGGPFTLGTTEAVHTLLQLPGSDIVAGGSFVTPEGDHDGIARWDGSDWQQLVPGTGGAVRVSVRTTNGDLLVGGDFTTFEGVPANRVALRSGGTWQALGQGLDGPVFAALALPNGDLVVGGDFTTAGSVAAANVARWDGTAWHALGAGLPDEVTKLLPGPGGQILASGRFFDCIAVWDGQSWSGTGIATTILWLLPTWDMVPLPGGEVLARTGLSGIIRRWDGQTWQPAIPSGVSASRLAISRSGDVYAAGPAVRRWNGTIWEQVGTSFNGPVQSILVLPDDDLLVAGTFTENGGNPMRGLARWNGASWLPVGNGQNGNVHELRWEPDGTVFLAGDFTLCDDVPTAGFGTLSTPCAATVGSLGTGCSGTGGPNTLAATELPWIGGEFSSRAEGLAVGSLAIEVLGLAAVQQPLGAVLPQAGATCDLLAQPDALRAYVAATPLDLTLTLPDTPSLVGTTLVQQIVALELDANGAITLATSSNALQATIGAF